MLGGDAYFREFVYGCLGANSGPGMCGGVGGSGISCVLEEVRPLLVKTVMGILFRNLYQTHRKPKDFILQFQWAPY